MECFFIASQLYFASQSYIAYGSYIGFASYISRKARSCGLYSLDRNSLKANITSAGHITHHR